MSLSKTWVNTDIKTISTITTGKLDANAAKENGQYSFFTCAINISKIDDYAFDTEAILLAGNGMFNVKWYIGKFNAYQRTYVIEPKLVHGKFLYYLIKTKLPEITENERGSTIPYIRLGDIQNIELQLPPLNEQKRIAKKLDELLSTVESIKTRLDNAPNIIKRFRQSILAAATSGKLTEEWRKENNVSDKWEELKIDNVLLDIRYGTSKKCSYDNEFTPVLRIPNISDNGITSDDLKYAQFNEKELENLSLEIGDILIIRSNGSLDLVGKNVVVTKAHKGYIFAGYLIRMRLDKKKVLPNYIHYVLTNPKTRAILNLTAKSTNGVNNVNSKELANIPISLPQLEEQKEIVFQVESLFTLADTLEEKIEAAKKRVDKLTQSILAKAFKGELVPQDPNDEPAEELLKQIKAEQKKEKPKKTRKKK